MKLLYKTPVLKQLKKVPYREQIRILHKIELLLESPLSGKVLKGELDGLRSLRSWPYRIIYSLEENNIIIYPVSHRQGAYK